MNDDEVVLLAVPLEDVATIAGALRMGAHGMAEYPTPTTDGNGYNRKRRYARLAMGYARELEREAHRVSDRRQAQHRARSRGR